MRLSYYVLYSVFIHAWIHTLLFAFYSNKNKPECTLLALVNNSILSAYLRYSNLASKPEG